MPKTTLSYRGSAITLEVPYHITIENSTIHIRFYVTIGTSIRYNEFSTIPIQNNHSERFAYVAPTVAGKRARSKCILNDVKLRKNLSKEMESNFSAQKKSYVQTLMTL